jgi:uncharacterized protein
MLLILSPSKTMDFTPYHFSNPTLPSFSEEAIVLNKILRKYKKGDLATLLGTSEKLTLQSLDEIKAFELDHTLANAKPAVLAFSGDVYTGLDVHSLAKNQLADAGRQIIILSGLYGALRGSDLIQTYRLDISAPIPTKAGKTLYPYWKDKITSFVNQYQVESQFDIIVNLASDEYAKAIDWKNITAPVINTDFLEERNGIRKVISFSAKKARGTMANLIIKQKIKSVAALKKLTIDGFTFDKLASTDDRLVYVKVC